MRCNVSYDSLLTLLQYASAGDVSPELAEAIDDAKRAMRHTNQRFGIN